MTTSVTVQVPQDARHRAVVVAIDAQPEGPSRTFRIDVAPGAERTFHAHDGRVIEVSEEMIDAVEVGAAAPAVARPVSSDEAVFEQQLQAAGGTAPRLTPEQIDATIVSEWYQLVPDTVMTICALTLRNGFTVIGYDGPVSPGNFDAEIGRQSARQNAREQIWRLEGYRLRSSLAHRDITVPRSSAADAV